MILRVYTMWARSRTILSILLFFFMLQAITSVVFPAIYNSSPVYFIRTSSFGCLAFINPSHSRNRPSFEFHRLWWHIYSQCPGTSWRLLRNPAISYQLRAVDSSCRPNPETVG